MKIIITMSLWLAVWLAAPSVRADAKEDFCESSRLGIRALEAIDRDVLPTFLASFKQSNGFKLEDAKYVHRRFCTSEEYLARNRWDLLSKSRKCTAVSVWNQIMVGWHTFFLAGEIYVPETILNDFASAGDASRRAMVALGCPGWVR